MKPSRSPAASVTPSPAPGSHLAVFPGAAGARSYNATPFFSAWWQPLARDATGRQMEALSRAGDAAAAARVADEYLRQYPRGPHAPLARTLHAEANSAREVKG